MSPFFVSLATDKRCCSQFSDAHPTLIGQANERQCMAKEGDDSIG
jgi:hypothetical protein